jgi:spore maturation protein CgeB
MKIAFYGSSLVSAYWNGAATYYRGLIKNLARLGYEVTFYEPNAFDRQAHRDMEPPDWAEVVVYQPTEAGLAAVLKKADQADIVVKASGVGVFDNELLAGVITHSRPEALRIFWDVDAPATLADMMIDERHPLHRALGDMDGVFTYGGGARVVAAYRTYGARFCVPIYNALDPETHHPAPSDPLYDADLAFLGNRLPDREERVHSFFFEAARLMPLRRCLLAGAGWGEASLPSNVHYIGHLPTGQHNSFNATPLAVLNISRESMATNGYSPATRVFEAAGAGACIITDAWEGIDEFLEPGSEILVARNGAEVAAHVEALSRDRAATIGQAAMRRISRDHTYAHRAEQVNRLLSQLVAARRPAERVPA